MAGSDGPQFGTQLAVGAGDEDGCIRFKNKTVLHSASAGFNRSLSDIMAFPAGIFPIDLQGRIIVADAAFGFFVVKRVAFVEDLGGFT